MAKKNYDELAEQIITLVGTAENVSYFTHCVTRLRFELKDHSRVNLEELQNVPGVLGTQWSGEQLQVIIGQTVSSVYEAVCKQTGLEKQAAVNEQLDDIKPALPLWAAA